MGYVGPSGKLLWAVSLGFAAGVLFVTVVPWFQGSFVPMQHRQDADVILRATRKGMIPSPRKSTDRMPVPRTMGGTPMLLSLTARPDGTKRVGMSR